MKSIDTGAPPRRGFFLTGTIGLLGLAGLASADVVDLTTPGAMGTINGAVFQQQVLQPAGTGVLNSFVRMQAPGNSTMQQGYNTSGRPAPFDVNNSPQFTRDLQLGSVPLVQFGGSSYYEFVLDINEPSAGPMSALSLDDVQIYASSTGGQTSTNLGDLGTLVYSMDAGGDNWVHLDASIAPGSGMTDMRMLIPEAVFAGFGAGDFVYLYSRFGENFAAQGGFEEWATVVPVPPAIWAGGACLAGLAAARVIRRQKIRALA